MLDRFGDVAVSIDHSADGPMTRLNLKSATRCEFPRDKRDPFNVGADIVLRPDSIPPRSANGSFYSAQNPLTHAPRIISGAPALPSRDRSAVPPPRPVTPKALQSNPGAALSTRLLFQSHFGPVSPRQAEGHGSLGAPVSIPGVEPDMAEDTAVPEASVAAKAAEAAAVAAQAVTAKPAALPVDMVSPDRRRLERHGVVDDVWRAHHQQEAAGDGEPAPGGSRGAAVRTLRAGGKKRRKKKLDTKYPQDDDAEHGGGNVDAADTERDAAGAGKHCSCSSTALRTSMPVFR